jgi:hypothetical protein
MFLLLALNISNSFLVKIDFYFFPKNPQLVLLLHLMRQIPSFMLIVYVDGKEYAWKISR